MKIEKRNGKLTQTTKLRHMTIRALKTGKNRHSFAGLARRLGIGIPKMIQVIKWLNQTGTINTTFEGRSVVFNF